MSETVKHDVTVVVSAAVSHLMALSALIVKLWQSEVTTYIWITCRRNSVLL